MEVEEGRAAIHEFDIASGTIRIFASGLRNAVGMAWEPQTGVLWTVVNERDGLGDETPPDYLTSVRDGGFYGWPYCYWGQTVDDRVPQDPAMVAKAITPDYALGGHTASLGLCWLPAGTLPGFPEWHGDRTARFLEPQQAEWIQAGLHTVREWAAGRTATRYPVRIPRAGRTGVLRTAGGRDDRPRRRRADGGRRWQRDLARDGRGTGLSGPAARLPPCMSCTWRLRGYIARSAEFPLYILPWINQLAGSRKLKMQEPTIPYDIEFVTIFDQGAWRSDVVRSASG